MATAAEIQTAAAAAIAARATADTASTAYTDAEAAAEALVTTEHAAFDAAYLVYDAALVTARTQVGWQAAVDAHQAAQLALAAANAALADAAATYDGQ